MVAFSNDEFVTLHALLVYIFGVQEKSAGVKVLTSCSSTLPLRETFSILLNTFFNDAYDHGYSDFTCSLEQANPQAAES